MPFAHQVGAQFRKLALPELWKPLVEFLAGHQRQHGVAQKLQLLIVADLVLAVPSLLRFLLARLRTVRYRLLNHRAPPEVIPQSQFQRRDFPFLHTWRQLEQNVCGESRRRPFGERQLTCLPQWCVGRVSSSPAPRSAPAPCRCSAWSADPVRPAPLCPPPNPAGPW